MKVNRERVKKDIEYILADGIVNGEEIDVTTKKIMDKIELIIRAAERAE